MKKEIREFRINGVNLKVEGNGVSKNGNLRYKVTVDDENKGYLPLCKAYKRDNDYMVCNFRYLKKTKNAYIQSCNLEHDLKILVDDLLMVKYNLDTKDIDDCIKFYKVSKKALLNDLQLFNDFIWNNSRAIIKLDLNGHSKWYANYLINKVNGECSFIRGNEKEIFLGRSLPFGDTLKYKNHDLINGVSYVDEI